LIDRVGARKVIVPSLLIFAACLISFYFLSARLWQFYAIYVVIGLVSGGTSTLPYFRVISDWFDRKRGLALALVMIGYGVGTFILPPLASWLIETVGWRRAYVVIGVMVVAVAVPVVALFLKEKPQMMGLCPDGESREPAVADKPAGHDFGLTTREALRTNTFWLIVIPIFLIATSIMGCSVHLIPLLTDRRLTPQTAALAASLTGAAVMLGRLVAGYLLDRYMASVVAVGFFCGAALGIFFLWSGATGMAAFVGAFLIGLGNGAEGEVLGYLVSRYFGMRSFGEIYGYALSSFTLGGVVGPLLMGIGFDATGSYRLVLGIFLLATLASAGLMTRLGPYRVWETAAVESAGSSIVRPLARQSECD
jgi:sugar phosphate permease